MGRLINQLESWDKALFQSLNGAHNTLFDGLMPWISDKYIWIPLYILLLYFLFKDTPIPFWQIVVGIALMILISDQVASGILKPSVERLRPCYDPALKESVHLLKGCGGRFGFASSHASNSFAAATFIWLLLRGTRKWAWLLLPWATLVAYSRVYLGVHFPGDILVGALIGIAAAQIIYFLLKRLNHKKIG